jgi:large subunit ribosomal protein L9
MAMEVLLRRTIEGVGHVGQVVRVKNGFARNYLLPQGLAAMVSPESLRRVEKDKREEAVRQAHLAKEREELARQLADVTLTVEVRAGDEGHLYGSVGARHVLAAFQDQGFKFTERQVRFEPVRELGEYEATVVLSQQVQVPVKVWVVQDAADARAMALEAAERASAEAEAATEGEGETLPEA